MRVNLNVPFVTQQGAPLEYNPNDCSQASNAGMINAYKGLNLTALDVAIATGTNDNKPQSMASVVRQAAVYGLTLNIRAAGNAIPAWYRAMLNDNKPCVALLDYAPLPKPGDFPHFLVVKGYDTDKGTFILNDPYQVNGGDWEVSESEFNAAIASSRYNLPYQGLYPTEALMPKLKGICWNTQTLFTDNLQGWIDSMKANPPAVVICVEFPARVQLVHEALAPIGTKVFFRKFFDGNGALVFPHGSAWHTLTLDELETKFAGDTFTAQAAGVSARERAVQFAMQGYDLNIEETIDELGTAQRTQIEHLSTRAQTAAVAPKGDDNSWSQMTPQQWFNAYLPYRNVAYGDYCDNEPGYNAQSIAWWSACADLCIAARRPAVLYNASVGTPHETSWHLAQDFLRKLSAHRGLLYLGIHEYAPSLTTYEFGKQTDPAHFPTVPLTARPYLTGRFRWLLDYCKSQGFTAPDIILTEWGWDSIADPSVAAWQTGIPGYEHGAGYQISKRAWQVWKPANWTVGKYAAYQLAWLWRHVYQPHPEIIGACLFTYNGAGAWRTHFRIEGEADFMSEIRNYDFSAGTTEETPTFDPTLDELVGTAWLRATPNGTALGQLSRGDVFIPSTEVKKAGNYYWRKGTSDKYGVGWAAVRTLDGKPVGWGMVVTL